MKEFAKKFYASTKWKRCREKFIGERIMIDGGLCQRCHIKPGYIVHHKIHLTPGNIDNPDIALNFNNLEYVCHDCHNAEHFKSPKRVQFDSDGMPIPPLKN